MRQGAVFVGEAEMKRILVATDFSTRSDRAVRRAILLARQFSAAIVILHVVDDDQPTRLREAEVRESAALLEEIAATVREIDRLSCETRLVLGDPFQAIVDSVHATDADLVVMGPHRRQALRDIFIGTTVERAIRISPRPVIMANDVPARRYDRVLVATDLSDGSAAAIADARGLGILDHTDIIVFHAFGSPSAGLIIRAGMTMDQLKDHIAEADARAMAELNEFLRRVDVQPRRRVTQLIEVSAAAAIREGIRAEKADLVVIGTHGRTGVAKFFLGSVAEEILRSSAIDVLVVPMTGNALREPHRPTASAS
jgi:nucleotide-binding universal stress UspA family protein